MAKPVLTTGEIGHHVFWPRKQYKGMLEYRFRNHRGLVVPVFSDRTLHANLEAPPKPSKAHIVGVMEHLDNTHEDLLRVPFWGIHRAIDYFATQAIRPHQAHSERVNARQIAAHLVNQLGYLTIEAANVQAAQEEKEYAIAA